MIAIINQWKISTAKKYNWFLFNLGKDKESEVPRHAISNNTIKYKFRLFIGFINRDVLIFTWLDNEAHWKWGCEVLQVVHCS